MGVASSATWLYRKPVAIGVAEVRRRAAPRLTVIAAIDNPREGRGRAGYPNMNVMLDSPNAGWRAERACVKIGGNELRPA